MTPAYTDIRMGDIVRMRKVHPCGSFQWEVVRLGADIGIRCQGCGRRVLIPRSQYLRQVKALISPGVLPDAQSPDGQSVAQNQ
jgi:hypothetical protein